MTTVQDRLWMQEQFTKLGETLTNVRVDIAKITSEQDRLTEENDALRDEVRKLNEKLDNVTGKMNKWESKFGVVMFIGTCLWAAFTTFKDDILKFIK